MKSIWKLIENGKFEEACSEVDLEYKQTGSFTNFGNKRLALFQLKKYDEVIELTNQMIFLQNKANPHLDLSSDSDYISKSIALWLLNETQEAIKFWQEGEKCKYTDAAGGIEIRVYQYFAAVKMNDENLKKRAITGIKKLLKGKRSINWPGPLGHYLIGDISAAELLSSVSEIHILRERQLCQAHFTIGIKELELGNLNAYKMQLHESIKDGNLAYLEDMFYMAKGELDNL